MTIDTTPRVFQSKEELYENLSVVAEDFKGPGISVIRGLKFSIEEQIELVKALGDIIGWYPNSSSKDLLHKYLENHASNGGLKSSDPDQIILDWHLEHVDYDEYVPLIGGVWNMLKFQCDPEAGKTYFSDSCLAYEMFTKEEQDFLSKCYLTWYDVNGSGPNYAPVVVSHWLSGNPLIRIEITKQVDTQLHKFDGRQPTDEEVHKFKELKNKFHDIIDNYEPHRIVHRWQEGDIVIPDLFRMGHAVTGGFDPSEREFNGFWLFSENPEGRAQEDMPIVWRDEWAKRND